jgi:hypothetical protein
LRRVGSLTFSMPLSASRSDASEMTRTPLTKAMPATCCTSACMPSCQPVYSRPRTSKGCRLQCRPHWLTRTTRAVGLGQAKLCRARGAGKWDLAEEAENRLHAANPVVAQTLERAIAARRVEGLNLPLERLLGHYHVDSLRGASVPGHICASCISTRLFAAQHAALFSTRAHMSTRAHTCAHMHTS